MKPILRATPHQKLRHQKGWRLVQVKQELIDQGTPISWPTLVNIDRGYKIFIIRDNKGKKQEEIKLPYKPGRGFLADLGKLYGVSPKKIYQDRSKL